MKHYVYQITNNINGKIYVGKRSCKCSIEKDTYFGSGTALKSAIKKYGKQNFTKTVIIICESSDEAYEIEKSIVTVDFIKRLDVYNLCVGGGEGAGVGETHPWFGKTHSSESKQKMSENSGTKGKPRSPETKAKMSAAMKLSTRFCKKSPEEIAKRNATRLANKLKKQAEIISILKRFN